MENTKIHNVQKTWLIIAIILSAVAIVLSIASLRGQYRKSHACGSQNAYLPPSQPLPYGSDYEGTIGSPDTVKLGVSDLGPQSSSDDCNNYGSLGNDPMFMEDGPPTWQ